MSGGSGGPIIDTDGYLIGVLFANLSFQDKDGLLQIPKSGIIIGKDIIKLTIECLKSGNLNKLWLFNIPNEELDEYFNYIKYNPKF